MNDLDRTLHDAFQSRPVPHDITPSLVDVRWRARRRHTRRNAALVGCAAITGAGAVAVLASRHPGEQNGVGAGTGAGEEVTPTTMACYSFPTTTTMPPTTAPVSVPMNTTIEVTPTTGFDVYQVPCDPNVGVQTEWHCTDQVGTDEFGRDVFLSCEQQLTGIVATTTPAATLPTVSTIEFPAGSTTTTSVPPTTTITIPLQTVSGDSTSTTSLG
jgi:hypothetical protein